MEIDTTDYNFEKVLDESSDNGLYFRGQFLTVFIKLVYEISKEETEESYLEILQVVHENHIVPFVKNLLLKGNWRVERLYSSAVD